MVWCARLDLCKTCFVFCVEVAARVSLVLSQHAWEECSRPEWWSFVASKSRPTRPDPYTYVPCSVASTSQSAF